jgi:hypothetical protein
VRDFSDVEVRYTTGPNTYVTSYCRGPEDGILRPNADIPGDTSTVLGRCRTVAAQVQHIKSPDMTKLAAGPMFATPILATTPVYLDWECNKISGCNGKVNFPTDYNGTTNFEYRVRTTELVATVKSPRADDWSPWKSVTLTVAPVPDMPVVTAVNLASLGSNQEPIKEDSVFAVTLVRANGSGATNYASTDLGPNGLPFGAAKRYYHAYFDVDQTNDIAEKIIITDIATINGIPVVKKSNGQAISLPDDSMFVCDGDGVCSAQFQTDSDLQTQYPVCFDSVVNVDVEKTLCYDPIGGAPWTSGRYSPQHELTKIHKCRSGHSVSNQFNRRRTHFKWCWR